MANTPFLDLVKPAGTDRALVSVINSNSDKIDTGVSTLSEQTGTYVIEANTLANIESALVTFGNTLATNEIRKIRFNISTASGVFGNQGYMGTIKHYGGSERFVVEVQNCDASGNGGVISGSYYNGAWQWQQIVGSFGEKTFASAKEMINYFRNLVSNVSYRKVPMFAYVTMSASESLLFGTSGFIAIATFTSSNYGNILCLSDNRASGGLKNICIAGSNAYIESFTASETSLSLT